MSEETNNLYEGMYCVSPMLSEGARAKALEKLERGIKDCGGEVRKVHDMGRRRLAYEIAGHREGYYFLLYFEVMPSSIAKLWEDYHLNEDLLRFVTFNDINVLYVQ